MLVDNYYTTQLIMMKTNLLFLLLLIATVSQSQDLEKYIPRDAIAVVEASGDQIFSLISYEDLEAMMPPDPSGTPTDLEQYGFNPKAKAYYFYNERDGISYQNFLVSLLDVNKAEELITSMIMAEPAVINGFKYANQETMTAAWSNTHAIFSMADFPKVEYTEADILEEQEQERLAAEEERLARIKEQHDNGNTDYTEDEADLLDEYGYEQNMEMQLMLKNMDAPYLQSEEEMTDILAQNFSTIVNMTPAQSIRQHKSYMNGKNSEASAYFWLNNLDNLVQDLMDSDMASSLQGMSGSMMGNLPFGNQAMPTGMTSIHSNLIFGKDEIKMESRFGLRPDLAAIYKDIYKSKMDRSFLNHFDADDVLSYMSLSADVAKTLEAYPTMVKSLYGSAFPEFYEELGLGIDLLEVFLDEKAIGELITGDALMVLHSMDSQEVTYISSEYDADYNLIEVEKTKQETLPIFTVMMGSENKDVISRMMRLGEKHKLAYTEGQHYHVPAKDMGSPFDVYYTYKDDILYITNSDKKVANYAAGKKTKNPGKHKKDLRNNAFNLYVNNTSLLNEVSDMLPLSPTTMDNLKYNYKELYMKSDMKDDNMSFDLIIKTSDTQENALKLLLDSFKTEMRI